MKQKNACLLSNLGLGDNISLIGALNFLLNYYENIYFIVKEHNKKNNELIHNGKPIIMQSLDNFGTFSNFIDYLEKNVDENVDIFVSGYHPYKSKITHPELLKYKPNHKKYEMFYKPIFNFYSQIGFDLIIYNEYFDIKSTKESQYYYDLIKDLKIIFTHTQASNKKIKLIIENNDDKFIKICVNENLYEKEHKYYDLANKFINIPIPYYIDIIKNSEEIYVINSCFSCIVFPLKFTNRLIAKKIKIMPRSPRKSPIIL